MYRFKMRETSWHDCLSCWVKLWPAQTCDIDSLLIMILMWSEGACMWTPLFPKHPNTCSSMDTCCGWHVKPFIWLGADSFPWASSHTEGPLSANQYLRLHQHRAIMRAGFPFKITHGGMRVCVVYVCVFVCIMYTWMCVYVLICGSMCVLVVLCLSL